MLEPRSTLVLYQVMGFLPFDLVLSQDEAVLPVSEGGCGYAFTPLLTIVAQSFEELVRRHTLRVKSLGEVA